MEEYYNMSADKTNVMRILDQKKIKYKVHEYKDSGAVSGVEVAAALGQELAISLFPDTQVQDVRRYGRCIDYYKK